MDNMEVSCVIYIKVSTFTHLEQSKISLLNVNKSGIDRLTVQQDLIVSLSFMNCPSDSLRKTSADALSFEQCPISRRQSSNFGCRTPQCIPVLKQPTIDGHSAHLRGVGNHFNFQLYAAEFILSITNMFAANYSNLTRS